MNIFLLMNSLITNMDVITGGIFLGYFSDHGLWSYPNMLLMTISSMPFLLIQLFMFQHPHKLNDALVFTCCLSKNVLDGIVHSDMFLATMWFTWCPSFWIEWNKRSGLEYGYHHLPPHYSLDLKNSPPWQRYLFLRWNQPW